MINELSHAINNLTKATKRRTKKLKAENAHKYYTKTERKYLQDKPDHDRVLAEELGRTYIAVSRARWYHKHRAKYR